MIDKCDIATRRAGAKKNHVMVKSDDARHHLFDLRKEALLALSATVRAYIQTLDLSDPIQSLVGLTAIAEPLAYEMYLSVQQRLTLTLLKVMQS